mgnify:FL=1
MADVTRLDEISLFANFYPIVGPVRPYLASQWPQKQVVGDFSKDSEKIISSWVINDQTEGLGVKEMDETKHAKRFFWSELNTDYPGHLFLPLGATNTNIDDPSLASLSLIEYNNGQYAVASGNTLRLWNNTTSAWGTTLGTLVGAPTDAIVHKNKQ